MRSRWLAAELAALALGIAIAWWLSEVATGAWLARVARLGVAGPDAETVRGLARRAALDVTIGIVVVAAARVVGPGLGDVRRRANAGDPLAVPWLFPAVVAASLIGLAIHLATVEIASGVAAAPSAVGFAQGFLLGCIAAAGILCVPIDLAELASRARVAVALTIAAIFAALAVAGSGPAGSGTRINLGPVQPIELVKLLVIVFLAAYLGERAPKLRWHRRRFLRLRWPRLELLAPAIGVLVGILAGLRLVGDLGPVLLLALVFLGMFFVASRATGWVVVAIALLAVALTVLALWPGLAGEGTVRTRLVMWRVPWTNAMSNGHQLAEGLWAVSAGAGAARGWRTPPPRWFPPARPISCSRR
jgi:cell division protein FtsW (lipid II flippase)